MTSTETAVLPRIEFQTDPRRYQHWKLTTESAVATLAMDVKEDATLRPGYLLKLNSYDLGVDIELADAVERLRFEHPEVRVVVLRSAKPNIFCAGANIYMLGTSSHGWKVNFCKFTNETRLAIEDASRHSNLRFIAALGGTASGGGYELALACDEILLVEDGNSAVSLPEVPLLGVLPGTGGLTRLVDKRKVRRDRADVFSTLAEGVKGQRALEWGLVDAIHPRSKFEAAVAARAAELAGASESAAAQTCKPQLQPQGISAGNSAGNPELQPRGIKLDPLEFAATPDGRRYRWISLEIDRGARLATVTLHVPDRAEHVTSDRFWPLAAFRELDHAILDLRVNEPEIGLVLLKTRGEIETVLAFDAMLENAEGDWFLRETRLFIARALRRVDLSAKSFFAIVDPGSCFAGTLLELALAADRTYMLDDPARPVRLASSPLNGGAYPMVHGLSRLQCRFHCEAAAIEPILATTAPFDTRRATALGLTTFAPDDLDWDDELRLAIEERSSLSPDALTGMEANLRFAGNENGDSKVFGRLTAWQNWIFIRPNATGPDGALTTYGKPERPSFDWKRV